MHSGKKELAGPRRGDTRPCSRFPIPFNASLVYHNARINSRGHVTFSSWARVRVTVTLTFTPDEGGHVTAQACMRTSVRLACCMRPRRRGLGRPASSDTMLGRGGWAKENDRRARSVRESVRPKSAKDPKGENRTSRDKVVLTIVWARDHLRSLARFWRACQACECARARARGTIHSHGRV